MVHAHNGHFLLHNILHGNMSKLYFFQALMTFVKSMIGIYIPIYLYSIGFTLIEVLIYSIGFSLAFLSAIPLSVMAINRFGYKITILFSMPIYILHILSVNYIVQDLYLYHIAWMTFGIYLGLFWPAFHSEIAVNGHRKSRGKEIGTLQIITAIFATMAPIVGGFILEYFGYNSLLILSIILLSISLIPLLMSKDIKVEKYSFVHSDYFRLALDRRYKNDKRAFQAEGIEGPLSLFIWPLFLFILLDGNFFKLGILFSIISIISVLVISYLKNYVDKHERKKMLSRTTKALSVSWLLRTLILFTGGIVIYIAETFFKLVIDVFRLTYNSIFYNNTKSSKPYLDYIIMREFYLHSTKTVFLLAVCVFLTFAGESLLTYSIITIAGVFAAFRLNYLPQN